MLNFILDILFPKFCVNCGLEGDYLCYDCLSLIEIADRQYCPFCNKRTLKACPKCKKNLSGLFCAAPYQNFIIKKLIRQFKYDPLVKDLSKILAKLIVIHLFNSHKISFFNDFVLVPVPLFRKKMKQRGFNQSEEIAKELSRIFKIPILKDALLKIKNTASQVDLEKEERQENIKGAFSCINTEIIKGRKVALVDDVYTTGETMEECAKTLKESGAKEVWGIAVAKG